MREIKDTLGIKYNKYTDIYKADNEQLGLLLKYIMWEFGKDVILNDVSELTKKRIEKKAKEIEEQIEKLLEDDSFERVFNSLTQQVKRSHHSWKLLKENLEKNKKKKNNDLVDEMQELKQPLTEHEEWEIVKAQMIEEQLRNEDGKPTLIQIDEEIEDEIDCEFDIATGEIRFFNESLSIIKDSNHKEDEIASFIYNNQEKFNSYKKGNYISIENIEDVLIEIDKAKDMQLPF